MRSWSRLIRSAPVVGCSGWIGRGAQSTLCLRRPYTDAFSGAPTLHPPGGGGTTSRAIDPDASATRSTVVAPSGLVEEVVMALSSSGTVRAQEDGEGAATSPPAAAASHQPLKAAACPVRVRNHVNGVVSVQPIRRFSDIAEELPQWLNQGIAGMGFPQPTVVQSYAIPLLMEEKDVVGIAPTGSGKTVAFAIPALATIDVAQRRRGSGKAEPTVLVLGPTRELTQQTKSVFVALGNGRVMTRAVFGGQDRDEQRGWLSQGADVVIATPGRLCDFVDSGDVSLEHVQFFVLDEADRMLEMGFAPQLRHIVQRLPKNPPKRRITMMWSATWSHTVEQLASGLLHPTQRLTVEVERDQKMNRDIEQRAYGLLDAGDRLQKMVDLYEQGHIDPKQKVIVFANRKETVDYVAEQLVLALRVSNAQLIQGLHGGMRQPKRDAILKKFRSGEVRVLVATDVAARGLDVPDIEHVINYDLPTDTDRYVHRIGRTGRAGRKGISHTMFTPADMGLAGDLSDFMETNGVKLTDDVLAVVRRHRFDGDRRQYSRYAKDSIMSNRSEATPDGDWRTAGRTPPPTRHGHGHGHGHRAGHAHRKPLRTITLKRDTPGDM